MKWTSFENEVRKTAEKCGHEILSAIAGVSIVIQLNNPKEKLDYKSIPNVRFYAQNGPILTLKMNF